MHLNKSSILSNKSSILSILRLKALLLLLLPAVAPLLYSCDDKEDEDTTRSTWEKYADYREENISWVAAEENRLDENGRKFYTRLNPQWNPQAYILIHWFNDRAETAENLRPLLTSTVNVWYVGRNSKYVVVDADSTSTSGRNFRVGNVIPGWQTALQNMHVGDSVQIILPYNQAYGAQQPSAEIQPYSALQFNIRLRDIPALEIP